MKNRSYKMFCAGVGMMILLTAAVYAQEPQLGKLTLTVTPRQSYVFVDGDAIAPGSRTIKLPAGTHKLLVANYGYKFVEQDVNVVEGQKTPVAVTLDKEGAAVMGPKGRIQIEVGHLDAGDDAVLLNGKSPKYFVGHIDEFNHNIGLKQELLVPPGTHQVTVTRKGKEIWSQPITVAENQRVIVNIMNGKTKIKDWPRGKS